MTRNNDTSYRQQGRAVFLAAIMVLSVVGASVAFTGAATAVQPNEVDQNNMPGVVYPGQTYNVNVDQNGNWDNTAYLVEIQRDAGDVDAFNLISTIENTGSAPAGDIQYQVDTDDTESGSEYAVANTSSYRGNDTNVTAEFVTGNEGFDATFDSDAVDNADQRDFVTLDSDRPITSFDVSVQADGLEYDQLVELFNASGAAAGSGDAEVTDPSDLPLNGTFGPDISDGDDLDDLKDENVLTLDLSTLDGDSRLQDDELGIYPSKLADGEGFPDDGNYEFEFTVTDTGASATDSIDMNERNVDVNFDTGSSQTPAGDIATLNLSFTDTDEAFVQIGGSESNFVDIIYVKQDDSEPVTVDINTRLLGTDADLDAVYDRGNTDDFGSVVHGGTDPATKADEATHGLYSNDGSAETEGDYFDELVDTTDPTDQLTRPLQATDYQVVAATDVDVDEGVFDADSDGAANNQLDSKTLTLEQPTINGVTIHKAPEDDADATTEVSELVDAATVAEEVAIDDRLVVQVEATGIYGAMIANMTDGQAPNDQDDWDRYADGVAKSQVLYNLTNDAADEGVDFSVEAESATGNQDPNSIELNSGDSEAYVVLDEENGQFFLIADTSDDGAFSGSAPEEVKSFTASLDYVADNSDNRYEFTDGNLEPFEATDSSENNFPYLLQGSDNTLSASTTFDLAPRQIAFDNLNADSEIQAQAAEDATISGTTNVAPGSSAELRLRSTSAADSFQYGNDINITEDGSVSTTFDLSDTTVGDQFSANLRVSGSQVDSANGVIVESIGTGDGEETNETDEPADDGEEMNETDEPADDGEMNESTDDGGDDGSTDDGTPGFGAVVALIALIGAALLAVRRQN